MKIISLNVNGVRASIKKGLIPFITKHSPDILGLNEVKVSNTQVPKELKDLKYEIYWNDSDRKGYAGTGVLIRSDIKQPIKITHGINDPEDMTDKEGRTMTLEFKKYYLVNLYVPNSGMEKLKFKERRINWDKYFYTYIRTLQKKKPVIIMGDLNVARFDTDVYDGLTNKNRKNTAGFTDYERTAFEKLLVDNKLLDIWHNLYPKYIPRDSYTFWSWRGKKLKENGKGWRIDYFLVSKKLKKKILSMKVLQEYKLSDHCPIVLELKI